MQLVKILSAAMMLAAAMPVAAEPIKCVVAGKTLYTDDAEKCAKGEVKPINGALVITELPAAKSAGKAAPVPAPAAADSLLDSLLQRLGITQQEVAAGWKTVDEARQRGEWQAPEMPEDAR